MFYGFASSTVNFNHICLHEAKLNVHHWGVLGVDNNNFWMLNMVYHLWLVEATNEMHAENISVEGKNVQM